MTQDKINRYAVACASLPDGKTGYERYVTCPHCGYSDHDSWEYNMNDGDVQEVECGNCGKTFETRCSVSVSYRSRKKGNDK